MESVAMDLLDGEFHTLIERIRARDPDAAAELVRRFEPSIRLKIRTWLRLHDPGLRRAFDTMDVCQSVLAEFFTRATAGQYELDDPQRVLGLLVVMARHKLGERRDHHHAQRRDVRRSRGIDLAEHAPDPGETPSAIVEAKEFMSTFRSKLSPDERALADLRVRGVEWADIAERIGGTPEARRKQWARAIERVSRELGLAPAVGNG